MATGVEIIEAGAVAGRRAGIRTVLDDQRWTLFAGLVVLNVLDLVSTMIVLSRGGDERNPFVQPFVESVWQIGLLKAVVLVLIATLLARCGESRLAGFALAITTGWYLAVVSWNVAVLTLI